RGAGAPAVAETAASAAKNASPPAATNPCGFDPWVVVLILATSPVPAAVPSVAQGCRPLTTSSAWKRSLPPAGPTGTGPNGSPGSPTARTIFGPALPSSAEK